MERSFVIIKPDAVQRGKVGEILSRFERKGFKIVGLKLVSITREQAEEQYSCHKGKPFFDSLVDFMISGPSVVMVVEAVDALILVRKLMGATDPLKAEPGTVRGDYAVDIKHNLLHGSDCKDSYAHEYPIYFSDAELLSYTLSLDEWLYYR